MNRNLVRTLGITLFLSAFLLFWCQPMVGKMMLPYLGGAAAVWTTCVLFFQTMLLGGYIYAHLLGRLPLRIQILVHALALIIPLAFLPIGLSGALAATAFNHPALALVQKLLETVGLPFFVISTTAPLLQNWLSSTQHSAGKDPYFLYAASNAGSLIALVLYPFFVEPRIGASDQSNVWAFGYSALIAMIWLSGALLWKAGAARRESLPSPEGDARPQSGVEIAKWIVPAFTASALMLAVTNHITSDLASAPFLWILPLAIYLLTFIVAFSPRLNPGPDRVSRLLPIALLALFPFVCADVIAPPGLNWVLIALHLLLLYLAALLCHAKLAERRPHASQLTAFYFWIALGGVLGGAFTASIAPMIFRTVLEYPILVALVAFLRTSPDKKYKATDSDWNYSAIVAIAVTIVWLVFRKTNVDADVTAPALAHTAFLAIAYKFRKRPFRFALTLTILMIAYSITLPQYIEGADRIFVTRDFFGVKKVLQKGDFRTLMHGDTTHGVENITRPAMPTSYYHSSGTVGQIMNALNRPLRRVGVLGLGTGTMAAYVAPERHITFFEIDPQVEQIARKYFTYLSHCGGNCNVVIGDGRLELQQMPHNSFDLLMLDAFSSDAVPAHLISREALRMYLEKIAPDGILLFHVSNRYLNVDKLVEQLVLDAGLVAFQRIDQPGELIKEGKTSTNHILVARRLEDLAQVERLDGWRRIINPPGIRVWTDDYSSLLDLVRWH